MKNSSVTSAGWINDLTSECVFDFFSWMKFPLCISLKVIWIVLGSKSDNPDEFLIFKVISDDLSLGAFWYDFGSSIFDKPAYVWPILQDHKIYHRPGFLSFNSRLEQPMPFCSCQMSDTFESYFHTYKINQKVLNRFSHFEELLMLILTLAFVLYHILLTLLIFWVLSKSRRIFLEDRVSKHPSIVFRN